MTAPATYTAFAGPRRLLTAPLPELLTHLKTQATGPVLVFDDRSGRPADFDLSGTLEEVLARARPAAEPDAPRSGPGRPKLGVTAREVTLLPRHWEWLDLQRGGASATLRRLIDEARRADPEGERVARAQAAADRFMGVLAGDRPGYEEAARALYARDHAAFLRHSEAWPEDVRAHALTLAAPVFAE